MTTNSIKFETADIAKAKGAGSISTLTFDIDITVEPVTSDNPMWPTHRVLGRSPRAASWSVAGSGRNRTERQVRTTLP